MQSMKVWQFVNLTLVLQVSFVPSRQSSPKAASEGCQDATFLLPETRLLLEHVLSACNVSVEVAHLYLEMGEISLYGHRFGF